MGAMVKVEAQSGWTAEQVELVKRTICKGANDDELQLFLHQCKRTGLDPFSRQIHAVKRWDGREKREVMTIQTGIDGYRLIADRTGKYAGNDDPVYDVEKAKHPNKATVTVWKIVDGQRVPFTRSAKWDEFAQTTKDGSLNRFWARMPYLMLGKVAEALALRAAFPQELSGLYTHEEMGQADADNDAEPAKLASPAHRVEPVAALPPARPSAPPAEPVGARTQPANGNGGNLPANGTELKARLEAYETKLAKDGVCKPGDLLKHVVTQGVSVCGYPADITQWTAAAMQFATDAVLDFVALRKKTNVTTTGPREPSAADPDGIYLDSWLREQGKLVHAAGRCENDDSLLDYIKKAGVTNNMPRDLTRWTGPDITAAVTLAKAWIRDQTKPVAA